MKMRPVIGVTPWYDYDKSMTYIRKGYIEGIDKAGGLPVILPVATSNEMLDEIVERFDGFLLSGGPDVDAKYYEESNLIFNGEISPYRDYMEIYITQKAIGCNKPVLGICRGIQIMNAAMGGTLYQDIYSQIEGKNIIKHSQNAPRWYPTHNVELVKDSIIWNTFKKDIIGVNSFHHQAVKDAAPGFKVTSRSADGIIESIEYIEHVFAVGVQWHPELMWQEDEIFLNLFRSFVEAASNK